ncbi:MAG: glycosyl transferase family 2 [Moraxellaceae bacterium]|nr:glycosyl transferase family 2 [Moraxellaceae bacterium]
MTVESLADQDYQGEIEIIAVVDGALANAATCQALLALCPEVQQRQRRGMRVLPKWQRGGRASSLNAGLAVAHGAIVMALDGDTSFERDMVRLAVARMQEPDVVALAGTLRVRNSGQNLLTRLQALDYLIFRQFVRTGLGAFNVINNVPGAHGIFQAGFLRKLGGWDTGSAEDVDIALRIKKFFGRYPSLLMTADPHVISHTDVPHEWSTFLRQRLRWEGDPVYLHFRKHGPGFRPAVLGWRNFLFTLWYGALFQTVMPLTLLFSLLAVLLVAEPFHVFQVLDAAYGIYFYLATMVWLLKLLLLGDQSGADFRLFWLLPLYPGFVLLLRIWSALAVLHNLLLRSHLDTSMAPWWVLKKGKF